VRLLVKRFLRAQDAGGVAERASGLLFDPQSRARQFQLMVPSLSTTEPGQGAIEAKAECSCEQGEYFLPNLDLERAPMTDEGTKRCAE
jgi:hypothetical protein